MQREKRKSRRRAMRYAARLVIGETIVRNCRIADISQTGARIRIDGARDLPDVFTLLLSTTGDSYRNCHAVWRTDNEVGVRFEQG